MTIEQIMNYMKEYCKDHVNLAPRQSINIKLYFNIITINGDTIICKTTRCDIYDNSNNNLISNNEPFVFSMYHPGWFIDDLSRTDNQGWENDLSLEKEHFVIYDETI